MANLPPQEEELFKKIEAEQIQVDPVLWNVIYQYIGDPIIAINFLVRSYIDDNQPLPKNEAAKIMDYTKKMLKVMENLEHPEASSNDDPEELFKEIREKNLKLDPVTDHLFRNYVRNDIYIINLIIGDYIDPYDDREAVSVEDAQKILGHIRTTISFMDRLRKATSQKEAY